MQSDAAAGAMARDVAPYLPHQWPIPHHIEDHVLVGLCGLAERCENLQRCLLRDQTAGGDAADLVVAVADGSPGRQLHAVPNDVDLVRRQPGTAESGRSGVAGHDDPVRSVVPAVCLPPVLLGETRGKIHAMAAQPHVDTEAKQDIEPAVSEVQVLDQDCFDLMLGEEARDRADALWSGGRVAGQWLEGQGGTVSARPCRAVPDRIASRRWVSDHHCPTGEEVVYVPPDEGLAHHADLG